MKTDVMFSSKTDLWETPQELFDKYDSIYHFEVDVCALPENAKCKIYYTPQQNGLAQEWSGVCWCNPPYGRQIGKWVEKAARSRATVVMLLPARTDTKWFHDYCLPYGEIEFLSGRLKFGGCKNSAPFPSMVVVFKCRADKKKNYIEADELTAFLSNVRKRLPKDSKDFFTRDEMLMNFEQYVDLLSKQMFTQRKDPSNFDRIKSYDLDQMADFLEKCDMQDIDYAQTFCDLCNGQFNCPECIRMWLAARADSPRGAEPCRCGQARLRSFLSP